MGYFGPCMLAKDVRCVLFARSGDVITQARSHALASHFDIPLEGTANPISPSSHFGVHRSQVPTSGLSVLITAGNLKPLLHQERACP